MLVHVVVANEAIGCFSLVVYFDQPFQQMSQNKHNKKPLWFTFLLIAYVIIWFLRYITLENCGSQAPKALYN